MIALVDGDILVYRYGFGFKDEPFGLVMKALDEFFIDLRDRLDLTDMEGFISGPSENNFRNKIAVTAPYKGQRKGERPEHYDSIRAYLKAEWEFVESVDDEADDRISLRAEELMKDTKPYIIVSIDKDLDQIPGKHYNFVKGVMYDISESEGIRNLYTQILTGDRIDNIIGLTGVGPVKAARLLGSSNTESEMFAACVDAYGGNRERVIENARLLCLKRSTKRYFESIEGIDIDTQKKKLY